MVGLHQEQTKDDPLAEEERRRRRDAVLDKLPHRQRSGSAYSISGSVENDHVTSIILLLPLAVNDFISNSIKNDVSVTITINVIDVKINIQYKKS